MSRSIARSVLTCLVLCAPSCCRLLRPRRSATPPPPTRGSAPSTRRSGTGGSRSWRAAAISRARRARATTFPGSTPRRNRRGSPTGRARWRRSTASRSTQLSPEEKVNAQVFRTSIRALANDVRFRTYEAPFNSDTFFWTEFTPRQGFATRRRVSRLSRAPARRAALLRRADRQHAGRPRARLHRAARVGRRPRQDDRAVREGRHDQSAVRAVHADAGDHLRGGSGGDARRSGDGDSRRRRAGVRAAPHHDARPSTCPRRARRSRRRRCPTARRTTRR